MTGKLRMTACFFCVRSWITTMTSNARIPRPTQAQTDMRSSVSVARPVADPPGIHVDERALHVQPDAAELLLLRPRVEADRRDVRDEEVDGVAVRVLAVARDLVALLAKDQVVLR